MKLSAFVCVCENDKKESFKLCCDSIFFQTVRPDQIVICLDGSIDRELEEYIYSLNGVQTVRVWSNGDHGISRRAAFEACTGELVAVMDSDDVAVCDRFEKQLLYFEKHPETDVLGGYIEEHTSDGKVRLRTLPLSDADIKKYAKKRCPFNHMTVMMKRSAVLSAGGYKSFYYNEDYYLWARMMKKGTVFSNLPDVLCHVNVDDGFYRRRGGFKYFKSEMSLFKFMRKNGLISFFEYICNGSIRFCVEVLIGASGRKYIYDKFLRMRGE